MKSLYSAKLEKLEVKLSTTKNEEVNIHGLLDKGIDSLLKLDSMYETSEPERREK